MVRGGVEGETCNSFAFLCLAQQLKRKLGEKLLGYTLAGRAKL